MPSKVRNLRWGHHSSVIIELLSKGEKCSLEITVDSHNMGALQNRIRTDVNDGYVVGSSMIWWGSFEDRTLPPTHPEYSSFPHEQARYKLSTPIPASNLVSVLAFIEPSFRWGSHEESKIFT